MFGLALMGRWLGLTENILQCNIYSDKLYPIPVALLGFNCGILFIIRK